MTDTNAWHPSRDELVRFANSVDTNDALTSKIKSHLEETGCDACWSLLDKMLTSEFEGLQIPDEVREPQQLDELSEEEKAFLIPGIRLVQRVGVGGMGAVYEAWQRTQELRFAGKTFVIERHVAVKVIRSKDLSRQTFLRRAISESAIAYQLQHSNILPVYGIGQIDPSDNSTISDCPFIVMKYVRGENLDSYVRKLPNLTGARTQLLSMFRSICEAVSHAHSRNVVHRDLKPLNVMLGLHSDKLQNKVVRDVFVTDWGLSKILGIAEPNVAQSATALRNPEVTAIRDPMNYETTGMRTLVFASPEQIDKRNGDYDKRSDAFSLGGILLYMLTGQPTYVSLKALPTQLDTAERQQVVKEIELELEQRAIAGDVRECIDRLVRHGVDERLIEIVRKCLAKKQNERFSDAQELRDEIDQYLNAAEQRATEERELRIRSEERLTRTRQLFISGVAAAIMICSVSFYGYSQRQENLRNSNETATKFVATAEALISRLQELATTFAVLDVDVPTINQRLGDIAGSVTTARDVNISALTKVDRSRFETSASALETALKETRGRFNAIEKFVEYRDDRFIITDESYRVADGRPVIYGRDGIKKYDELLSLLAKAKVLDETQTLEELAKTLRAYNISNHVRQALDDWFILSFLPEEAEQRKRLASLAERLDDGANRALRVEIRNAVIALDDSKLCELADQYRGLDVSGDDGIFTGLLLADGLLENLRIRVAAEVLQKAMRAGELSKSSTFVRFWCADVLGAALTHIGSRKELQLALTYFHSAIQLRPDADFVRANMVLPYLSILQFEEALEVLAPIVNKKNDKVKHLIKGVLGGAYAVNGETQKAREIALELEHEADSIFALQQACEIYERLLDTESEIRVARDALQRLDRTNPVFMKSAFEQNVKELSEAVKVIPEARRKKCWKLQEVLARSVLQQGGDPNAIQDANDKWSKIGFHSVYGSIIDLSTNRIPAISKHKKLTALANVIANAPDVVIAALPDPLIILALDDEKALRMASSRVLSGASIWKSNYLPGHMMSLLTTGFAVKDEYPDLTATYFEHTIEAIKKLEAQGYGGHNMWIQYIENINNAKEAAENAAERKKEDAKQSESQ